MPPNHIPLLHQASKRNLSTRRSSGFCLLGNGNSSERSHGLHVCLGRHDFAVTNVRSQQLEVVHVERGRKGVEEFGLLVCGVAEGVRGADGYLLFVITSHPTAFVVCMLLRQRLSCLLLLAGGRWEIDTRRSAKDKKWKIGTGGLRLHSRLRGHLRSWWLLNRTRDAR